MQHHVYAAPASKVGPPEVALDQMPNTLLASQASHLEVAAGQMSSDARRAIPCSSTATRRPARSSSSADAPPNLRAEQGGPDPSPAVRMLRPQSQTCQACHQTKKKSARCNARFFHRHENQCSVDLSCRRSTHHCRSMQPSRELCQVCVSRNDVVVQIVHMDPPSMGLVHPQSNIAIQKLRVDTLLQSSLTQAGA